MEVFFFQIKIDQKQKNFINIFDLTIMIDMTMLTTMRESERDSLPSIFPPVQSWPSI
jgi:hypothetical protein